MEEMHKTQGVGKDEEFPCPLQVHHSPQISMCSPVQKFSKHHPFGFLWRLNYTGVADEIIGHC